MPEPSAETTEALEDCERVEDQPDCWAEPSCHELGWDELACDEPDFTRLTSRHRGAVRDRGYSIKPTARQLGAPHRSRLRQVLATGRDNPGASMGAAAGRSGQSSAYVMWSPLR